MKRQRGATLLVAVIALGVISAVLIAAVGGGWRRAEGTVRAYQEDENALIEARGEIYAAADALDPKEESGTLRTAWRWKDSSGAERTSVVTARWRRGAGVELYDWTEE